MKVPTLVAALGALSLAACANSDTLDPDVTEAVDTQAEQTPFTPREVVPGDIPSDIQEDSWARLPTIARESLDADARRVFDLIVNPDSRYAGGLRGPIGMWMYSPRMAEHIFPASTYLRYGADGTRDQRLTELAILATARELDSQYEWSAHEPAARTAGREDEIIDFVRYNQPLIEASTVPSLGAPERAVIQVARELINEPRLSSEAFAAAQALFGNEGVMDLAGLIGYYTFVNYTLKTFDVQRTPGSQLLLPLP